jgi:hypothetical protein
VLLQILAEFEPGVVGGDMDAHASQFRRYATNEASL